MSLTTFPKMDQGTQEWLDARRGLVTASAVGQLLTVGSLGPDGYGCPACEASAGDPCVSMAKRKGDEASSIKTFHPQRHDAALAGRETSAPVIEVADNDTSRALTSLLVAERITGWSDPTFVSADMARGHDVEPIARDLYSETVTPVTELGFMYREYDTENAIDLPDRLSFKIGFSPDGLVGDDGLIEVKAPRSKAHLLTHLSGEVPLAHMPQIQCGLEVADRDWCDFISFYAGMPPFIKRVHRDERWGAAIVKAVARFEKKAARMQAEYEAKTTGLPATERLLTDMEIF